MKKYAAENIVDSMKPGRVYRRQELAEHSCSLSRDLERLIEQERIVRAAPGLYYKPKMTSVGPAPATSEELVRAFLNDGEFLLTSFNEYNLLGLGFTQLYNQQYVYNRKRHGDFVLDGRHFSFRRPRNFPDKLTKEFLFVDLLNNKNEFSGDNTEFEAIVASKVKEMNPAELRDTAVKYGKISTRKFFERELNKRAVAA